MPSVKSSETITRQTMRTELEKEYERVMEKFRSLNIQPRMKIEYTGGKLQGTFDLRSLNKAIIEKCR